MNSKARHTSDPAGLYRKPGLVCSHIDENRKKQRENIYTDEIQSLEDLPQH